MRNEWSVFVQINIFGTEVCSHMCTGTIVPEISALIAKDLIEKIEKAEETSKSMGTMFRLLDERGLKECITLSIVEIESNDEMVEAKEELADELLRDLRKKVPSRLESL